jgi:hypothetical protein
VKTPTIVATKATSPNEKASTNPTNPHYGRETVSRLRLHLRSFDGFRAFHL